VEYLVEIIIEIIFEGSSEGMKNKKIPMWLRIVCTIIVSLIFLFAIGIIGLVAIAIWEDYYHIPSILFFALDIVIITCTVLKIRNSVNKDNTL
jgi:biotin transporter BioY